MKNWRDRIDLREQILAELKSHPESRSSTNYARVHNVIRRDIIVGVFRSGERLKTSELTKRYGLSAVPIREALQKLAGEGLVDMEANRGTSVRAIDGGFLLQLHEMREVLAAHITAASVTAMTDEVIEALEVIEEVYEGFLTAEDRGGTVRANGLFHRTLETCADNQVIKDVLRNHSDLLETLRLEVWFTPERLRTMPEEHRELLAACRARDGAAAAEITVRHVRNSRDDFLFRIPALRSESSGSAERSGALAGATGSSIADLWGQKGPTQTRGPG